MKRQSTLTSLSLASLLALGAACSDHSQPLAPEGAEPHTASRGGSVVQVAPPTGTYPADRVSIEAALAQVQPGGTVQFAPGMYMIGNPIPGTWDFIRVTVPGLTLVGHADGTTLRGCELALIDDGSCNGLQLSGGHQTLRDLTMEGMLVALELGDGNLLPIQNVVGGYLVEESTFRNSAIGVWISDGWPQPAVIRQNTFENVSRAVVGFGRIFHVLDNEFSNPQPELIPFYDRGWKAIVSDGWTVPCDDNVFVGNQIDGFVDGIGFEVWEPGEACRRNVVRNNTIRASGAFDLQTWRANAIYLSDGSQGAGFVENNLIQANHIIGAEGTDIELAWASRNRIVNNTISGVKPMRREFRYEGNGVTVWAGEQNQIVRNYFDDPATLPFDIGSAAVLLLGNHNHVGTTRATDLVRDLGVGNKVTGPGHVIPYSASAAGATHARGEAPRGLREGRGRAGVLREREGLRAAPR